MTETKHPRLHYSSVNPDSKVHGANMGPTWVLSAPYGPLVGPMNLAIREGYYGSPSQSVAHMVWICAACDVLYKIDHCNSRYWKARKDYTWWRHQIETFYASLAFCAGDSTVQTPVTRSFDVLFDLPLDQQLSKQWRRQWFETPSRSLWRHCNEYVIRICEEWRQRNFFPRVHLTIMAWWLPGNKPFSKPMMVNLLTHICVTRLQCVNIQYISKNVLQFPIITHSEQPTNKDSNYTWMTKTYTA